MKSRYWLVVVRVCSLLAVLFSAALLMHYLAPEDSGFCGAQSGCEAVRKSALVKALPPYAIPALGVAGYLAIFWLSFLPPFRQALRWGGALGGIIAIGFILQQALGIGVFCWMCVTVDVLAIATAFGCLAVSNAANEQWDPLRGWGWALLLGVAINAPTIWVKIKPSESLPASIERLQKPGVLNVIEFADFECPHCRRLHPTIKSAITTLPTPVELQRFHVPLPFHIHAESAARAAICAARMGKEEEMADLLFGLPLREHVWLEHAKKLALDERAFRTCFDAADTTETLADHVDLFKSTGARGLPLTFIGRETLHGSPDPALVRETFAKAITPRSPRVSAPVFAVILMLVAGAIVLIFRKRTTAETTPV